MSRAQYEANSKPRTRPWELEGISRRTWYRHRGTSTVPRKEYLLADTQPVPTGNGTAEKGVGEQKANGNGSDALSALWALLGQGCRRGASRVH